MLCTTIVEYLDIQNHYIKKYIFKFIYLSKNKIKNIKPTNIIINVITPVEKDILYEKINRYIFKNMIDEFRDTAC